MPYLLRVRRFYATLSGRNRPRFLTNDSRSCTSTLRIIRSTQNPLQCPPYTTVCGGIAMVPTLFFYELGLIALVWVCLMLYWLWPNDSAARRQPIALSKPPRRKQPNQP